MENFYENKVKLSSDDNDKLKGYADINKNRLIKGLEKSDYALPEKFSYQGSYATKTINQHLNSDYDIDIAVIFKEADINGDPLEARKRILAAILKEGGNFKKDPEIRTNAVTVWYAEGYHIDFAIHRIDTAGNLQHAGVEWTNRDPIALANWINDYNRRYSPNHSQGVLVKEHQFRRIVQLIKCFTKSRESWNLPGGLYISILASEAYQPNNDRDDLAFYQTIHDILLRLESKIDVYNPIDPGFKLNYKSEYTNQLLRLKDSLKTNITSLDPLFEGSCSRESALQAWQKFFNNDYWSELKNTGEPSRNKKIIFSPIKPYSNKI